MKEIKIRIYDKKFKKMMLPGDICHLDGDVTDCLVEFPYLIPMLYTGLKDKNLKEIYDGDVCQCLAYDLEGRKHLVRGDLEIEEIETVINNIYDKSWPCVSLRCVDLQSIEVMGNIHQNPELLEPKGK